ncbi:hypothetical protein P280DRAFT_484820 [Massarina eburnea CBS 473.64]|uniref:Protein kinase domain-containing protein n=1 Tax=Massarina eburnea CBS 473.64 TaxID=1395130 RepID=A0A6A6RLA1_9PLEO|nr:hypothetical protein P280DRAFT_484820 [Massarina eburnea CBS 473.64]
MSPPTTSQKDDPKTYSFYLTQRFNADNTRYIIRDSEGQIYWGLQTRPIQIISRLSRNDIALLPRKPLDATQFFPTFDPETMTKFEPSMHSRADVFVKKQALLNSPNFMYRPKRYYDLTMHELQVGEQLAKDPHPHLCRYLGVIVNPITNLVMGLAYKKYDCDLLGYFSLKKYETPRLSAEEAKMISDSVKSAVDAIHAKGFVHCDIRPPNIFLKVDSEVEESDWDEGPSSTWKIKEVVVGDFDASLKRGAQIELKIANEWWRPASFGFGSKADFEIDNFSVARLEEWLEKKM